MQWLFHPSTAYSTQSFLGRFAVKFHCKILDITSSCRQNFAQHPCWTHSWFQTSRTYCWLCKLCLRFLQPPYCWCHKEYHFPTWEYNWSTNLTLPLLTVHYPEIASPPLFRCPLSLTYWTPRPTLERLEWPTYFEYWCNHQNILLITPWHTKLPIICNFDQSNWITCWWIQPPLPTYTSCPRFCHHNGIRSLQCYPWFLYSQEPTQLPHPPIHWRSLWHLYQHTLHNTPTFSLSPTSNCWHHMCSIHSYLWPHQSLPHFGIP